MFTRSRIKIHARLASLGVAACAVAISLAAAGCAKVAGIYTYEHSGGSASFSAKDYVDKIWDTKVLPTIDNRAVDAVQLLAELKANPAAAAAEHGKQSGVGGAYSYPIKGAGTVIKYDQSAPSGPLTVRLAGSRQEVFIATGPVLAGTALRDGVGFINFGDFPNQIDYAAVGDALNAKAKATVIAKNPPQSLVNKHITFAGAFSALTPQSVLVIPTMLRVAS